MPAGPSRVGTITDPLKGRVVTDEYLNKVSADSPEATFVFHQADLTRLQERREALGLGTVDEAKRAQRDSRVIEAAAAERRIASLEAEIAGIREAVKADASDKDAPTAERAARR